MLTATRSCETIRLTAADGHVLGAYLARPQQRVRHAPSAELARERTLALLREHIG